MLMRTQPKSASQSQDDFSQAIWEVTANMWKTSELESRLAADRLGRSSQVAPNLCPFGGEGAVSEETLLSCEETT